MGAQSINPLNNIPLTVAVITSTIGRRSLIRAIESVQSQSYPAKHYVFIDGSQYADAAREILQHYPSVTPIYLPMNTGAGGWTNSSINAIAPFLVKEDCLCYLDDDNQFEPDHIRHCVQTLISHQADYVYTFRSFYYDNLLICPDICESIGIYEKRLPQPFHFTVRKGNLQLEMSLSLSKTAHIDTNCYFIRRETALRLAQAWYSGLQNDTNVYRSLQTLNCKGACTHQFSVKYQYDPQRFFGKQFFQSLENLGIESEAAIGCAHQLVYLKYLSQLNAYDGQFPNAEHHSQIAHQNLPLAAIFSHTPDEL